MRNVFTGYNSGNISNSNDNTFNGYASGQSNISGVENSFFGSNSGLNSTGKDNTFFGFSSGITNQTGKYNTLIGSGSDIGFNDIKNCVAVGNVAIAGTVSGDDFATAIGSNSNAGAMYSTALGSLTVSCEPYSIILGDNNENVGIGLSNTCVNFAGIGYGPKRYLDIYDNQLNSPQFRLSYKMDANNTLGSYTDFQAQAQGYLGIFPQDDALGSGTIYDSRVEILTNNPYATLEVHDDFIKMDPANITNMAGLFWNTGTGLYCPNIMGTNEMIGIKGLTDFINLSGCKDRNVGGDFNAINSILENIGVIAQGYGISAVNYGGQFSALAGVTNIAVYGSVTPGAGTFNYGIFGNVVGGGTTLPDYAGYFNGDVANTGLMYFASDINLKQNIQPLSGDSALYFIRSVQPKTYCFNQAANMSMSLPQGHQYGLISQQVEPILPGFVKNCVHPATYDSLGNIIDSAVHYLSLNYQEFTPLIIAAIKKIDSVIQEQQEQINQLQNCCEQNGSGNRHANPNDTTATTETITLKNYIVLDQNTPNPYGEQTTITFVIPQSIVKAQIIFYDMAGRMVNQKELTTRGSGSLQVYAQDLSSGTYTYSLFADGRLIDTKKMVKQ